VRHMLFRLATLFAVLLGACSENESWTQEERSNAQFILDAWNSANEANRIQNSIDADASNDQINTQMMLVISNLRTAYEHGQAVHDNVLDKVHPEMRGHWKDEFLEGLRLRLLNLESKVGSLHLETSGSDKLDIYGEWMMENRNNIKIPKKE
jgi:hypothetical protein